MADIPCYPYKNVNQITLNSLQSATLVQGSVESIIAALKRLGQPVPEPVYYPFSLHPYLGRPVWSTQYGKLSNADFPLFVKSHAWKKLTGAVQTSYNSNIPDTLQVWCSTPVNFVAEWRVYVQGGKIIHAARYDDNADDLPMSLNWETVVKAIHRLDSEHPRASYAFDWGLTEDGQTLLIENNDAWAIGAYGDISPMAYSEFLIARWKEVTGNHAERPIAIGM